MAPPAILIGNGSWFIYTSPAITTTSLASGNVGAVYPAQTLAATGSSPVTWSITSGSLPTGLTLDGATGVISGTPTVAVTSSVTFRATNPGGFNDKALSIVIATASNAPTITYPTSLSAGTVGTAYSVQFTATGSTPITWSVTAGTLPTGLTFSSSGLLSGTPTATASGSITFTATNGVGSANAPLSLTVSANNTPTLTSLSSYGNIVGTTDFTVTATGTFQSGDQIELWNTLLSTTYVNSTTLTATVTTAKMASANFGCIRIARGTARSYPLPFEAYPNQTVSSNYVTGLSSAVLPNYGAGGAGTHPAKGAAITQTFSGSSVRRITSIADTAPAANGVANFRNIYSKWSSTNSTGEYIFVDIENSTTCYLYRLIDGVCLGKITGLSTPGGSFGENFEPRWSSRGDEPYTVYYLDGANGYGGSKLYKKDIVNGTAEVLVKDFTTILTINVAAGEYLYCDSEGNSSMDMRYWSFMHRGSAGNAIQFLVYDVLTDTVQKAKPVATTGYAVLSSGLPTNTNEFFDRPNWVSMSPRGDRVQIAWGKWAPVGITYAVYDDVKFASRLGTPANFVTTYNATDWSDPKPCANDATHGAWSWGSNMEQVWTSQNNSVDAMESCLDVNSLLNNYATINGGAATVTVSSASATTFSGYTNVWNVVLSATIPTITAVGDIFCCYDNHTGSPHYANETVGDPPNYLIVAKSGSTLTVAGDPFGVTRTPFAKISGTTGTGALTFCTSTFSAANPATNGRRKFLDLSGTWNNGYGNEPGQHYMWQMSGIRRGFAFVGTDGTYNSNGYGYSNLLCIRISDGRIWRVSNFPHQHADYFSEIQWCINPFGMSFVGSLNWQDGAYTGTPRTRDEVYAINIDKNWHTNAIWS